MPINTHAIRGLVGELDQLVPRRDASVAVANEQPNGCSLLGNRTGYLRLGIELLKAGLAEAPSPAGAAGLVDVELAYLLDPRSPATLGPLRRRPEDFQAEDAEQAKFETTFRSLFLIVMVFLGIAAAIGMVGVAIWFTS